MKAFNILLLCISMFALGFVANEYAHRSARPASDISAVAEQEIRSAPTSTPMSAPTVSPIIAATAEPTKSAELSWDDINQLIAAGRYDEAKALLKNNEKTDSAQAWLALAHIYQKQNQPVPALDAWFRYLALETNAQSIERALREIKSYLLHVKDTPALFNDDIAWLMAQFETLAKYTASDAELHLVMAALALQLNDNYQAQYHALVAVNDPVAQKRAEDILSKLNGEKLPEEITIPLTPYGRQYLVAVKVEGINARLLLDTGASLSGLSSDYTNKYQSLLKNTRPIKLNTAGGVKDALLFTVSSISMGNITFNQHMLAQLPMEQTEFDGLLGVDILGRFDFVIDQDAGLLKLKTRKNNNR